MNLKTLLVTATMLIPAAQLSAAEVLVEGNANVDASFIAGQFPDKKKLTQSDIDKAIKELYASGAFTDVSVTNARGGVLVRVTETPVPVNIVFNGNDRIDDDKLAGAVGMTAGSPYDPARIEDAVKKIKDAYGKTGRRNVAVTSAVNRRQDGFYDVSFEIDEGDRTKTEDVWFDGNASFTDLKLRNVVATKRTGILSKLFTTDVIDDAKLAADRQRVIEFYHAKGFADVIVSEPEVDFDEDGRNVKVGFKIDEGKQYVVGKTLVENSTGATISGVERHADALRGRLYDEKSATKAADDIAREVEAAGVFPVEVTARPSRNVDGTVDVGFVIDKSTPVYVERIEISGNQVTKDYVIRREFDLAEGDLLNPRLIRDAKRRLERLGFFKAVNIYTAKGSANDRAVLKVDVVEESSGEFTVGGAYSPSDGPMAILSVTENNFMGTGRRISASIGQGTETDNYEFSITEPYLLGNRISATTSVFRRTFSAQNGGFRPYDETLDGARFTLNAPITNTVDLGVYYSLTHSQKTITDPVMKQFVGAQDVVKSSVGYDLTYSNLDNERDPHDGLRATLGQEFGGLGGDVGFIRSEASTRVYHELSERNEVVASVAVKGGQIAGLGEPLSFSDHFKPGTELVRGFQSGGFGPRDSVTGYMLGGQYYAGATAETLFPLPLVSDGLGIKGSVFADMGTVWGLDGKAVAKTGADPFGNRPAIRAAIGTGVVWDSPLGLFKANFAIPVMKEDADKTQVFSISGGTRF